MRDPNLRMFMSNICNDSPMFDYVEQLSGRAVKSSIEETKNDSKLPKKIQSSI